MEGIQQLIESPPQWSSADELAIRQPYNHIASIPGKNFRTQLIFLFNSFYELEDTTLRSVTEIIEILHNSSLLIDDIEDNSQLRRGVVAAHMVYNIPMTINTANYMYFEAMNLLRKLSTDEAITSSLMAIFNEELQNLHRGQGLDIYWRDHLQEFIPTEDMYFNMVMNKTGGLFRLTLRIMEKLSPKWRNKTTLVPLGNLLGIIYQIRDDFLNLADEHMMENKGYADDISEGKLSFPIIHGLNFAKDQDNGNTLLMDILQSKKKDDGTKRIAVNYLQNKSKSLSYCRIVLQKLNSQLHSKSYFPKDLYEEKSETSLAIEKLYEMFKFLATV
ncbi:Geranylgeranyl pyrophosphate synthase BTS1 [Nakaseomyces bracarensis]|uniref:Geranylgeranyl pyrophosphate synthase BTS1 n=1 Tax=Nakaseomyces bracarensis TaxID=273131 RepID=A0ABR4NXX6_9SACH